MWRPSGDQKGFDAPSVAEYEPAARGRLPADFSGSAYDAVLLGDRPGPDDGIDWLRDLSRRNGFPPIIYLLSRPSPETEEHAIHAGLSERAQSPEHRTADADARRAERQGLEHVGPAAHPAVEKDGHAPGDLGYHFG